MGTKPTESVFLLSLFSCVQLHHDVPFDFLLPHITTRVKNYKQAETRARSKKITGSKEIIDMTDTGAAAAIDKKRKPETETVAGAAAPEIKKPKEGEVPTDSDASMGVASTAAVLAAAAAASATVPPAASAAAASSSSAVPSKYVSVPSTVPGSTLFEAGLGESGGLWIDPATRFKHFAGRVAPGEQPDIDTRAHTDKICNKHVGISTTQYLASLAATFRYEIAVSTHAMHTGVTIMISAIRAHTAVVFLCVWQSVALGKFRPQDVDHAPVGTYPHFDLVDMRRLGMEQFLKDRGIWREYPDFNHTMFDVRLSPYLFQTFYIADESGDWPCMQVYVIGGQFDVMMPQHDIDDDDELSAKPNVCVYAPPEKVSWHVP